MKDKKFECVLYGFSLMEVILGVVLSVVFGVVVGVVFFVYKLVEMVVKLLKEEECVFGQIYYIEGLWQLGKVKQWCIKWK